MHFEHAAIPWYPSAIDYEQFRAAANDPEDFFDSFDQWLDAATNHQQRAQWNGVMIIRIRMKLNDFNSWIQTSAYKNDGEGRSVYAQQKADALFPQPNSKADASHGLRRL